MNISLSLNKNRHARKSYLQKPLCEQVLKFPRSTARHKLSKETNNNTKRSFFILFTF